MVGPRISPMQVMRKDCTKQGHDRHNSLHKYLVITAGAYPLHQSSH